MDPTNWSTSQQRAPNPLLPANSQPTFPFPPPAGQLPYASTSTAPYPYTFDPLQPPYPASSSFFSPPPPPSASSERFPAPLYAAPPDEGPHEGVGAISEREGTDTPEVQEEGRSGEAAGGGGTTKLSNAKMSKKPKPRPPVPQGVQVTDKSCARCRARKVRCNRIFPRCDHCTQRGEDCDLATWKPKPKVKSNDPVRVAALEKRLAELEEQLKKDAEAPQKAVDSAQPANLDPPALPDPFNLPPDRHAFDPISALSDLAATELPFPPLFHPQQQPPLLAFDPVLQPHKSDSPASSDSGAAIVSSIGVSSLDWRLAMPAMASSLSQHLTEAFADSCCFLLPTFEYWRVRMGSLIASVGRQNELSAAERVAIFAFSAVGARTSPHSAVLGISLKPSDAVDHPNAPLLSAGTRRQNASRALYEQAHLRNFEAATMEEATVENLAALLAVLQLTLFAEVTPSKSRPLLRSALSHYRELQDTASTEEALRSVRRTFGLALYSSDCLVAACARRKPLITNEDLRVYFPHTDTKIVVPRLPGDDLLPMVEKFLASMPARETALKSAKHLLACWTSALQRKFAFLSAPPLSQLDVLAAGIQDLWQAVDNTRGAAQYLLAVAPPATHDHPPHSHPHTGSAGGHHTVHEHDYGAQIIRLDRDLLDLINLLHVLIVSLPSGSLPVECARESLIRVRMGLKTRARVFHSYAAGLDVHMTFHELFALEHLPNWTSIVLQRVGDVGGPLSVEEELNETELSWFIEGLQHSAYYHPLSERRLLELAPRFSEEDVRLDLSPHIASVSIPSGWSHPKFRPSDALFPTPSPPNTANPAIGTGTPTPPSFPLTYSPLFGVVSDSGAVSGLPSPPPPVLGPSSVPPPRQAGEISPLAFDRLSPLFGGTGGAVGGGGGEARGVGGGGGAGMEYGLPSLEDLEALEWRSRRASMSEGSGWSAAQ